VTACYAENNIPYVGEADVQLGREMSWLRIERYWEGGEDGEPPEARFIPVMCQHCDNAPCEPVCPVYASYHTPDGLNGRSTTAAGALLQQQLPYKVRYFPEPTRRRPSRPLNLQLNPEVTVRARGGWRMHLRPADPGRQHQAAGRPEVLMSDVVTASPRPARRAPSPRQHQHRASRVARAAADPRGYHVLEEINVRPSVTYLAKVLHGAEA
jgi:molybdopterin-containing oxidoreductase family iron-sulfur binding subunit